MGFFGKLMNGMGGMLGEQLWPLYEQGQRTDGYTLKSYVENETNMTRRAVYLLALAEKDSYAAKEIYEESKNRYNNMLANLKNYYRFESVINNFMREMN